MPKISALTSLAQASVDTAADVLPIVDATAPATTKKVTVQAMVNAGLAAAAPQGGTLALTGALTVSGQAVFSGANAGLELGAKASANTPFIDFNSSGNSNDYDARIIASAGTTAGTGNLTVFLNSFNISGALGVTGQSTFAAGTAAAPSVKVGGEQNGLFSSTANTLDVTVGGLRQARFLNVASAVNYGQLQGASTGFAPIWSSQGSDTNINWIATSKGSGGVLLYTNLGTALQLAVTHVASAVNYWDFTGAATGNGIRVDATGSDSGVNGFFVAKGSGVWNFCTSGSSGNRQFQIGHTASAVNYAQITGSATGSPPVFSVAGTDANISILNDTKGSGSFFVRTGSGTALQLAVTHTASAVNWAQITGSATGGYIGFAAAGSDTNIDFAITPKGTGNVRFGTHSAIAAETVTGYITIKDSSGTERKLAVLS